MKILSLLLLSVSLFLLSGCKESSLETIDSFNEQSPTLFSQILPADTGTHLKEEIIITEGTGEVIQGLNESSQRYHVWTKRVEKGEEYFSAIETGHIYTYIYKDLGIKISTPIFGIPYFYELVKLPLFERNGNLIYASSSLSGSVEYIEMFTKDPNVSLRNIIKQFHLETGCFIDPIMPDNTYFSKWTGFDTKNIFGISRTYDPNTTICSYDNQYPNMNSIVFVQSLYHKEKYYKVSFGDACAPGPCSIFGNIEFLD